MPHFIRWKHILNSMFLLLISDNLVVMTGFSPEVLVSMVKLILIIIYRHLWESYISIGQLYSITRECMPDSPHVVELWSVIGDVETRRASAADCGWWEAKSSVSSASAAEGGVDRGTWWENVWPLELIRGAWLVVPVHTWHVCGVQKKKHMHKTVKISQN